MYVDSKLIDGKVFVSERVNGARRIKTFPAPFDYYCDYPDKDYEADQTANNLSKTFTGLYGDRLRKRIFRSKKDMLNQIMNDVSSGYRIYESDIRPEYKILERQYRDTPAPKLNVAVFDIEVETLPGRGFASYVNPYGRINAITIHQKWLGKCLTYALAPPTMTTDEAQALINDIPDAYVLETEHELLTLFLEAIEDADVITGWNSEGYDIPMLIQRIRLILGDDDFERIAQYDPGPAAKHQLKKLCLFQQSPTARQFINQFGQEETTFNLCGRVHLDYMQLYKALTFTSQPSYRLDYILQIELGERKVPYNGTLHQLWCNDFRKFIEYAIQDTMGLSKVDDKKNFIGLSVEVTHTSCVNLPDTLGSVSKIEHAIIVELHRQGKVAPDKSPSEDGDKVAGGFVYKPEGGKYDWVASFDLNSLYPSVIRLLNISPETVIGQFNTSRTEQKISKLISSGECKTRTDAWHHFAACLEYHDIIDEKDTELELLLETGDKETAKASEWKTMLKENNLVVTGNGTVFDMSQEGIIPYCLTKWYQDRIETRAKSKKCRDDGDDDGYKYYDMVQQVRKVFLNATYGALLNAYFRFNDERFGQSVTLSGRVISQHMAKDACYLIDGEYDLGKSLIYMDTDSAYVHIEDYLKSLDADLEDDDLLCDIADNLGETLNDRFPKAMSEMFLVTEEHGGVIQCKRETVATSSLFKDKKKKRYALACLDFDGKRKREIKTVGFETERSDTPVFVQDFMKECLNDVLLGQANYNDIKAKSEEFIQTVEKMPIENLGKPSSASKVTIGKIERDRWREGMEKPHIHYAVSAALNFNDYLEYFNDTSMEPILDGDKVRIFPLLENRQKNPLGAKYIALSSGASFISDWFYTMPFDMYQIKDNFVISKLHSIFDMLHWDFTPPDTDSDNVFVYN